MAASGSSDAGNVCPCPASILLLDAGYLLASRNDTTARARSRNDHTVEVTFWIADPPAVSFYTFHCIRAPSSDSKVVDVDRGVHSVVAGAHGRFLLIRTLLSMNTEYEYFVYKGHPKSPSLESIPINPFDDMLHRTEFGIVPRGDDGHYLLVALRDMVNNHYRLYIYSSEDTAWTYKELPNPCPEVGTIMVHKVFTLGNGLVLFVDLLQGMLTCDLYQESHHAQYIPLPEPMPANRESVKKYLPGVRLFRDLTCVDGLIKFVEIENRVIDREIVSDAPPEKPVDPRTKDVFHDSELIMLSKRKPVEIKPKIQRSADGWSATMWTRKIGSDFWLKGSVVDVNDILVDDSVFSALLSNKRESSAGSLTFKDLQCAHPTLSADGNDILYLKLFTNQLGIPVRATVDLEEKILKEAPRVHNFRKYPPQQILRPCALANHLEITPGIKVSANLIALLGRSANEPKPNSSAIGVGDPGSFESKNKRLRHLAEKVNHAQTGAHSTVQNVLISQAHRNQNNMPPRLCFNRYQRPRYSGYSSWPHQNYQPPPPPPPLSYFNNWAAPYNPVYVPSAPAQSYVNYQSLPQQPLLQEQQTTTSMTFGPHMAHPTTAVMAPATMGIGSSVNPYAYGAHSGSGLYHQH